MYYRHHLLVLSFALQLELFPELMDEVITLAGGSLGMLRAIVETVGNEISYSPMEDTTTQRIRQIVGAPDDDLQRGEWRGNFWDQFKVSNKPT